MILTITPSSRTLPEGLTEEVWLNAVRTAAGAWSYPALPCTSFELRVLPLKHLRLAVEDSESIVVFRTESWCRNERCSPTDVFPARAAGMTTTYPEGASGHLVTEGDIELNGVRYRFEGSDLVSRDAGDRIPLGTVLVHEFGHLAGFATSARSIRRRCARPQASRCRRPPMSRPCAGFIDAICRQPRGLGNEQPSRWSNAARVAAGSANSRRAPSPTGWPPH